MEKSGETLVSEVHSEQCVELDSIVETFDKWQLIISDLTKRKTELTEEIKTLKTDKERIFRKNNELEKNIGDLQRMIDTLHKQLHTMCDMEEDITKGQTEIQSKTKDLSDARLEIYTQKMKHNEQMEKLKQENVEEISRITKELTEEKNTEIEKLQESMEQKNYEIYHLQEKLEKSFTEKESEILKLSVDHENKLAKLKQKTSVAPAQSSSANQEIFRKKLQHLKTEYDREVNHLKYTISDLQEKLASQGNMGRMTLSSGKKRRT